MKFIMRFFNKFKNHAQSATELAIFGGVLIFVIAGVVRSGMSANQLMNQQIKIFRTAMTESYKTSEGLYNPNQWQPSAARATASFLLIEDRLAVDPRDKFGVRNRVPYVSTSSATFSRNLFYPVDYEEWASLPLYDVIVNGLHFPFYTADFKSVNLTTAPLCDTLPGRGFCWEPDCYEERRLECNPDPMCSDMGTCDCDPVCCEAAGFPWVENIYVNGCALLYKLVTNCPNCKGWCDDDMSGSCESTPCTKNIPADERFDLDFDGIPDVPAGGIERCEFNWQWMLVAGVRDNIKDDLILEDLLGNPLVGVRGISAEDNINTILDADGDLHEETILNIRVTDTTAGQIDRLRILDSQEGDLNFQTDDRDSGVWKIVPPISSGPCSPITPTGSCTIGDTDYAEDWSGMCQDWECKPIRLGVQEEIMMFTFTRDGTVLRNEEGQLFNPGNGQFVRNTNSQENIDIIQRGFQLSKDTGHFCNPNTDLPTDWSAPRYYVGIDNPVEACGNCFSQDHVELTCFDKLRNLIFIRSRIQDLRRRRWVTRYDPQG